MSNRAGLALAVLTLVGLTARTPGQTQPIPTAKAVPPARTAQIPFEPGAIDPALVPPGPDELAPLPPVPPPGDGLDECAVVDPPSPHVRIRVRVPSVAPAGKELEYRLTVENVGRGAAHRTVVRVALPPGAALVRATPEPSTTDPEPRWQLGTLPGCGCKEITLVVAPGDAADVRLCARVLHEYGQCVVTRLTAKVLPPPDIRVVPVPRPMPDPEPRPQPPTPVPPMPMPPEPAGPANLTVKTTAPAEALVFDIVPFVLDVTNTGPGTAREVVVTASPAAGLDFSSAVPKETSDNPLTWAVGNLAPGQRKRIELNLIAKKTGTLALDVDAQEAGGPKKSERAQVRVGEVKLAIRKDGPKRRTLNSVATYFIQVTNTGTIPAANVVVTDEIPREIEFVRASANGKLSGTEVRWELGTLAPGERKSVQLELRSKQAGTLVNRATARTDRMVKGVVAEAETVFENATGLTVEIDRDPPVIGIGDVGQFTVRIINQGDGDAEEVGVVVTLPMQLTAMEATGPQGVDVARNGGVLTFTKLAKLPPRQFAEYKIKATGAVAGEGKMSADVTAKTLTKPLRVEEGTTVFSDR